MLDLRLEAANLFNSVNIARIGTTVNASIYGLALDGRIHAHPFDQREVPVLICDSLPPSLAFALLLPAQPQAQQGRVPDAGFKISVNTNLVVVNVDVRDKSGKPIEDLKPCRLHRARRRQAAEDLGLRIPAAG